MSRMGVLVVDGEVPVVLGAMLAAGLERPGVTARTPGNAASALAMRAPNPAAPMV
jgi:hypothetical protein